MPRYAYLWEFTVEPVHVDEFMRHYGPEGSWVALFRTAPGYVNTALLRDTSSAVRFVTIDRWQSESAYRAFRSQRAREYAALDQLCERLTTREVALGEYNEIVA